MIDIAGAMVENSAITNRDRSMLKGVARNVRLDLDVFKLLQGKLGLYIY